MAEVTPEMAMTATLFMITVLGALSAFLGWIYKKGKSEGMDSACVRRIEEKIDKHIQDAEDWRKEDYNIHLELRDGIKNLTDHMLRHFDKHT